MLDPGDSVSISYFGDSSDESNILSHTLNPSFNGAKELDSPFIYFSQDSTYVNFKISSNIINSGRLVITDTTLTTSPTVGDRFTSIILNPAKYQLEVVGLSIG